MATPRFRRVNIDGQSLHKTETRLAAEALLPGTLVQINSSSNKFEYVDAPEGRMYVVDVGYHEGLNIMEPIPVDHSAVGNYLEDGREFALRFAASTALVKDQPITIGANGLAEAGVEGTDLIIGYSQETVTLPSGAQDFIRVRARQFTAVDAA